VDNDSGTVFEGQFFTRPYRRFEPAGLAAAAGAAAGGFAAWFATRGPLDLDCSDPIGFFGGDRRRARFELRDAGPVALRELCERVAAAAAEGESEGFLLSLLTPALQPAAAPGEAEVEVDRHAPIAAALGRPAYASGWDVDKNLPRPLRALIPAGSVYFFDWPEGARPGAPRAELVRRLWLQPVRREGAAAGFGRCLPGIWR
jgi:CRISPR-associated protein Cmr3